MKDVFGNLRNRLDDLASGYPATKTDIELKILKKLFTEEEASLFMQLSPLLESPDEAAARLDLDSIEITERMEHMASKGLLFRVRKENTIRYSIVPFVPGIYDFQVKRMDQGFAQDIKDYTEEGLGVTIQGHGTPIMRSIPINKEIVAQWPIAPYEDVMTIIDAQDVIAVAPCVCRTKSGLLDESCGKPLETCFMFGSQAKYYVENLMGRFVDKEEAKSIVKNNEKAGLVMQPMNAQNASVMCSCCGDCCEMLGSLKKQPVPAEAVKSNYFASLNADDCTGCEICLDRCQMEAITLKEDTAAVNLARCIGCGLCVTTCPTEALSLVKKLDNEQYQAPKSGAEMMMRLASERNKHLFANE